MREGERWKAAARKSEELLRQRDDAAMKLRFELEESKLASSKKAQMDAHRAADELPLEEMRQALLSAQDDLVSKDDEAKGLSAKVARLEAAIQSLM